MIVQFNVPIQTYMAFECVSLAADAEESGGTGAAAAKASQQNVAVNVATPFCSSLFSFSIHPLLTMLLQRVLLVVPTTTKSYSLCIAR